MKNIINPISEMDKLITETKVFEVMITSLKYLNENDTVSKAIELMANFSISGVLVNNNKNKTVGIVSEGDIIKKVLYKKLNPDKIKLKEIMSKNLYTINKDKSIGEAAELMKKNNISKLPIINDKEEMIGYITKADLLEKLNEIYYQNTRLKWLPILFLLELIVICILIWLYLNK